jgi:hypothetical protein
MENSATLKGFALASMGQYQAICLRFVHRAFVLFGS